MSNGIAQPMTPVGDWRPTPLITSSVGLHCLSAVGTVYNPDAWPWALGSLAANHAFLTAVGLWPRGSWLGPNVTRLTPAAAARREICITFDDGPDPNVTPRVLDILDEYGAKATFFCIADRCEKHPAICRELTRRGHGIENHSLRHLRTFALLGLAGIRAEIAKAQVLITDTAGVSPSFFRPPAGVRSPLLDPVLHRLGLRLVNWTRRGFDTRYQPERVIAKLVADLAAGDILLLHDGRSAVTPGGSPVVI
ncbi:MAG: polysaccharide deacetylase family protein, partial [Pseudomonadota bacterium]|nr:polysaccharide deacetylase family protein [Pseudomonadota bacterium]